MKKIFLLLAAATFALASCSDDDKDTGSFRLVASNSEVLNYEATRTFNIFLTDIARVDVVAAPAGWDVVVESDVLSITAPARGEASAERTGMITLAPHDIYGNALSRRELWVECGLLCDFESAEAEAVLAADIAGSNLGDGYTGYTDVVTGLSMPTNVGFYGQNFSAGGTAVSRWNDMHTESWHNQCSVFYQDNTPVCSLPQRGYGYGAGYGGHNGSQTFGVCLYDSYGATPTKMMFPDGEAYTIDRMWVCNSTYATLSMRNGDNYAKRFTSGDWFKMIVDGYAADGTPTATEEFYLADFRTNTAGGIKYGWNELDLSSLGEVNTIKISFDSSDKSALGYLNTPAYVCIDDILVL